jgi:hypothetical protein
MATEQDVGSVEIGSIEQVRRRQQEETHRR